MATVAPAATVAPIFLTIRNDADRITDDIGPVSNTTFNL